MSAQRHSMDVAQHSPSRSAVSSTSSLSLKQPRVDLALLGLRAPIEIPSQVSLTLAEEVGNPKK